MVSVSSKGKEGGLQDKKVVTESPLTEQDTGSSGDTALHGTEIRREKKRGNRGDSWEKKK